MCSGPLHLPDLSITDFRGIRRLSINKLGRVSLIAGLNGVGKTTVLEAVRVYAARGDQDVLREVLLSREEFTKILDEDRDRRAYPDYTALFFGRNASPDQPISIGPVSSQDNLKIEATDIRNVPKSHQELLYKLNTEATQVLRVTYHDAEVVLPWLSYPLASIGRDSIRHVPRALLRTKVSRRDMPDPINCESLGPGLPENHVLTSYWDKVVLTPQEPLVLKALSLTGQQIDRTAVVGDDGRRSQSLGRRFVAKMSDQSQPIPLKSLGDGITRLFAASLALAVSGDGFLTIDEVENGIHYSIQYEFWRLVLKAAHANNVQVLATTHSLDCIKAFASAANEIEESEGVLIRLEGEDGDLRAIEYTEEELEIASDQDIEVR
jgi:predicted ATPase